MDSMEFASKFASPYASVPQLTACSAPRLGSEMDYCVRDLPDFYSPQVDTIKQRDKNDSKKCKRRLEFCTLDKMVPPNVARRNERERNRVRLINTTFSTLRQHLPGYCKTTCKNKKLSKVDTLKSAIDYIAQLQELLDENDAVNAAFQNGVMRAATFTKMAAEQQQAWSPASGRSHGDDSETERESTDGDLVHFTNWF